MGAPPPCWGGCPSPPPPRGACVGLSRQMIFSPRPVGVVLLLPPLCVGGAPPPLLLFYEGRDRFISPSWRRGAGPSFYLPPRAERKLWFSYTAPPSVCSPPAGWFFSFFSLFSPPYLPPSLVLCGGVDSFPLPETMRGGLSLPPPLAGRSL